MEQAPRRFHAFISYAQAADGAFAPALEQGLEMLAKPWNRRRALEVFRDSTGLSPTPHLWPDIRRALDDSQWLVLLASPESAGSRWVGDEISHWLDTKGPAGLIIVLTGGACVWDDAAKDFDMSVSSAVHPALAGAFEHEPLYIDMRWARGETPGTETWLDDARFRQAVAQIAAPMHGLAPEDLESEAVRQERRLRHLARSAVAVFAVLAAVATLFAVLFAGEAETVARQRDAAIARALVADGERLGENDPELARRLALTAWRLSPTAESRANLLAALARPGLAVLAGRRGQVAFDPAGLLLATGNQLWDVAARRPAGELPVHGSVAFSADGRTLATVEDGGMIGLWDARKRQRLGQVPGSDATFSTKGSRLAVVDGERVSVWDAATRKRVMRVGHEHVTDAAFSPDGRWLVTASEARIVVWEVPTGRKVRTLRDIAGQGGVSLAVSPDGRTVATGAATVHSGPDDRRVRLWDVKAGEWLGDLDGHTDEVTALDFSADGTALAAASADETVLVWDLATRRPAVPPLRGHTDAVVSVAFAPGGLLASAQESGEVRLWDVGAGFTLGPGHSSGVDTVVFSRDGMLATGSGGSGAPRYGLPLGDRDDSIRLWSGRQTKGRLRLGGVDSVYALAFTADGRLVSGADSGKVTVWDPATGARLGPAIKARAPVTAVAVNADATMIVTSSVGAHLKVWDLATGRPIARKIAANAENLSSSSLAFSPKDSGLLVAADAGNTARLWDTGSGTPVATLSGHAGAVTAVAFSPDGRTVATGSSDNTVRLWDARTGAPVGGRIGAGADVTSLAFNPVTGLLAIGDDDGDVRQWDLAARRPVGEAFPAHIYAVNAMAFSPDGGTLATGGEDFEVRLWDVRATLDPARTLCARAPRPLTAAQWAAYLPDVAYEQRLQPC